MPLLKQYAFGIVASEGSAASSRRALLAELCSALSPSMGFMLLPHVAPTYRALATAVERGIASFAWMPPLLVLELEARGVASPLMLPLRRGSTASFYSGIISRNGGPRSIHELDGARAAWVDNESVAGYLVARMHLAAQGVDLKKLGREVFLHSHDAVVDALVADRADVGATFCTLDPQNQRIVHAAWTSPDGQSWKPVNVLATAGPIPNDAIVVGKTVPREVVDRALAIFSSLEGRRPRELVTALLRAEGFTRATASHYAPLKAILARAKAEGIA